MSSYSESLLSNELMPKDTSKKDRFYYDETNNIRKFILRENGFNNDIANAYFVLGGLIIKEKQEPSIETLKEQLKLGSEVLEIKFKSLTGKKKDLFSLLNYPKIQALIKWIYDSKICIHFTAMNFLYFSLADIPDSIANDKASLNALFTFYRPLKDALYQEVMKDIESYISLFHKYGYPNIKKTSVKDFASGLYDIYFSNYESTDLIEDFPKELLRQMLKQAKTADELVFLHDNEDYTLIEDFAPTYINQLIRYPNSKHILDNEYEIEARILETDKKIGNYIDYKFIDSKEDVYVQLSDTIVSIIARVLSFLEYNNKNKIHVFLENLNTNQLKTLNFLIKIINRSEEYSQYTTAFIASDTMLSRWRFMFQTLAQNLNTRDN